MAQMTEKQAFMKQVTILIDTREQQNQHIIQTLDKYGVQHMNKKLDYGDYSFVVGDVDFENVCVIERKGCIDELYGNCTGDRERIEKELDTISKNAKQCVLLFENCASWDFLKSYMVPDEDMQKQNRKVQNIGATVYSALQAWQTGNRFNFRVEFNADLTKSALKMLEIFYWYYHNYKKAVAPRNNDAK